MFIQSWLAHIKANFVDLLTSGARYPRSSAPLRKAAFRYQYQSNMKKSIP